MYPIVLILACCQTQTVQATSFGNDGYEPFFVTHGVEFVCPGATASLTGNGMTVTGTKCIAADDIFGNGFQ